MPTFHLTHSALPRLTVPCLAPCQGQAKTQGKQRCKANARLSGPSSNHLGFPNQSKNGPSASASAPANLQSRLQPSATKSGLGSNPATLLDRHLQLCRAARQTHLLVSGSVSLKFRPPPDPPSRPCAALEAFPRRRACSGKAAQATVFSLPQKHSLGAVPTAAKPPRQLPSWLQRRLQQQQLPAALAVRSQVLLPPQQVSRCTGNATSAAPNLSCIPCCGHSKPSAVAGAKRPPFHASSAPGQAHCVAGNAASSAVIAACSKASPSPRFGQPWILHSIAQPTCRHSSTTHQISTSCKAPGPKSKPFAARQRPSAAILTASRAAMPIIESPLFPQASGCNQRELCCWLWPSLKQNARFANANLSDWALPG